MATIIQQAIDEDKETPTLDLAALLATRQQRRAVPPASSDDAILQLAIKMGTPQENKNVDAAARLATTPTVPAVGGQTAPSELHKYIIESAQMRNLDPAKALAMFKQESNFEPGAIGKGGEIGLGQFTQSTAAGRKLDTNRLQSDPQYNVDASLDYLRELTEKRGGDIDKGLVAYNGGGDPNYLANVNRHIPETQKLVSGYYHGGVQVPQVTSGLGVLGQIGKSAVGTAEAWYSILSNIPAFLIGRSGEAAGVLTSPHRLFEPGFLTGLHNEANALIERYTYQPQTEEGKRQVAILGAIPSMVSGILESSRESNVRLGLPEGLSHILKDASEIAAFYLGDKTFRDVFQKRALVSRFKADLKNVSPEHPWSEAVLQSAEELVTAVEDTPAAKAKLQAVRQRLVDTLKSQEAERNRTRELFPPTEQPELPFARTQPAPTTEVAPPEGATQLEAHFPEEGLFTPSVQYPERRVGAPPAVTSAVQKAMDRVAAAEAELTAQAPRSSLAARAREFRAATAELTKLRGQEEQPVTTPKTTPVSIIETTPTIPEVPDNTPAIAKPKQARAPRKVIKAVEPTEITPGVDVGELAKTPKAPRVNYYPATGINIEKVLSENVLADTEPSTPPSGPLSIRYAEGKPNAILVDPYAFSGVTPLETIREQVAHDRISPEMAQVMERKLQQQADFFGVPIEQAHQFGSTELLDKVTKLAHERGLELYTVKRTKTGLEYEQVPPEFLRAADKLHNRSPLEPTHLTKEDAATYVVEKTKPVGDAMLDEITKALDNNDESIIQRLPKDIGDHVKELFDQRRKGIDTTENRNILAVLTDLVDVINPLGLSDPNILGSLALYGLTPERRAAISRLAGDAMRAGRSIKSILTEARVPEAEQTLFERYLEAIKRPLPTPRVQATDFRLGQEQAGEPVFHQRAVVRDGELVTQPPVYRSEARMLQRGEDLPDVQGLTKIGPMTIPERNFAVPAFTLRRAGLSDVYHAYLASVRAGEREAILFARDLNAMSKVHDLASQERMGEYGYSFSEQGINILIKNGKDIQTLNLNEQKTFAIGREWFDNAWLRVNEVREASGKEPVPYIDDYAPFMRAMSLAEKLGKRVNLMTDSVSTIMDNVGRMGDMMMPREKLRTGATYKADFNYFHMLQDYMHQVAEQIHLAPFINKLDELVYHNLPDPVTGKPTWSLAENKPNLYRYMNDWRNLLVNGPTKIKNAYGEWALQGLMRNTSHSMIAYSPSTTAVQLGTLVEASHALGPHRVVAGALDALVDSTVYFFDPKGTRMHQLYERSGVIDTRGMQETFSDVSSAIIGTRPADFLRLMKRGQVGDLMKTFDKAIGYKFMQLADHMAAVITGLGAMRMADYINKYNVKTYGEPLLKGEKYWDFVDSAIVRTNGGTAPGDIASIQRQTGWRALTHMQRFVINSWNYIIEDVIGVRGHKDIAAMLDRNPNKYVPAVVKSILSFTAITAAYNYVQEDILGLRSSFGRPIKALGKGIEQGENLFRIARSIVGELADPLPIVGRARYSPELGGVVGTLGVQAIDMLSENPLAYKMYRPGDTAVETAERLYGSPLAKLLGLRGASQMTKVVRAQDRNLGFWPSVTGMIDDQAPQRAMGLSSGRLRSGAGIVRTLR